MEVQINLRKLVIVINGRVGCAAAVNVENLGIGFRKDKL
jgi:hypothetical protein